jgi:catechol 2,3-dioxygenase-like lactoylglutathione lyase family enzyme
MIDHVGANVSDYERSRDFYAQALEPLGYSLLMEPVGGHGGFGREGKPDFWISGIARADHGQRARRARRA